MKLYQCVYGEESVFVVASTFDAAVITARHETGGEPEAVHVVATEQSGLYFAAGAYRPTEPVTH
jgi:hypothetical protein